MAPKKPIPKNTGTPGNPPGASIPLSTPRVELPGLTRSAGPDARLPEPHHSTQLPSGETLPRIQIQDLIPASLERASSGHPRPTENIRHYELTPHARTLLPAVNAEGLRVHRGRIYAEVQYTTTSTVMVDWDEGAGTYRAKLPQEMRPSGPALHFDPQSNTWRIGEPADSGVLIESAVHRPVVNPQNTPSQALASLAQSDTTAVYIDTRHYVWDSTTTHHHGYVVMHRKMRLDDTVGPQSIHAFRDDNGLFVSVEPPTHPIDQPAELLPAWTDRDIWNLYGLQGADITRFRAEAHRTGRKPQWAGVRTDRMENTYLFDELRRWLGPDMDRDMLSRVLDHQKRSPAQWVNHLESVTLHRSTPDPQTSLPNLATPDTPLSRHLTPDSLAATDSAPAYGDQRYYTWDPDKSNAHGYIEMQRKPELDDRHGPLTQVAFPEGTELTIVRPIKYSVEQRAFRPYWRDIDIWNLYRIEGADILHFRQDVALHLKPPAWVRQRDYPSQREQLIDYLRLWTNPDSPLKSRDQVIARFRPYNLSTEQLARLSNEISPTGQFNNLINDEVPTWVKTHQARTLVVTRFEQFDPYLPEFEAEIIRLRNQGGGTSLLKASLTAPFFRELLQRCGFKRNKHNYLYRDDIPAVFKVDDRTPFEFARPGSMQPRPLATEGSTSGTAVSALFSLRTAMSFANEARGLSASPGGHPNAPQTAHESKQTTDATSRPRSQRIMFCYLLDTRGIEVVSGQDNRTYNTTRITPKPADDSRLFPSMKLEGHVSMSPIGFTSRRIWLVNSTMTRAATVDDIHTQARERATGSSQSHDNAIEGRTRAGDLNRDEYDALIDEVAKAGKRVLELPQGKDLFSTDISFPPELISLS
ncbi:MULTISPECIES: hypothetical protein [unclassified Pseudomonas]|uniref:hypothetical protein n=1 Tax=unclassified Pseudomonas TaxID=196821 RepID=UPI00111BF3F6|nr:MULTISPECIES: hypothetical protein [unclassified Pseudomonas]MDI2143785.1 hypothetical protein [Pseudomonas sp. ITA]